jgi:multiple sugar transport system substrate-binding protein
MLHHNESWRGKEIPALWPSGMRNRRVLARGFPARRGKLPAAFVLPLTGLLLASAHVALADTLVINANTSNPAPRAAWEAAIADFEAEYPEIEVEFNVYDHESYKKAIRNWLTSASPDVVYWFVGNRMRQFVTPGLLEDVSDVFTPEVRDQMAQAALDLVTVEGRQYGVPYTYYHIGVYYRRDLLADAEIEQPPRDWSELLEACAKLKARGIGPIALGSKDLWPTAGWFDYIDLRLNGYDFHMALMGGTVPYTDQRVKDVFAKWRELIDRQCFIDHHVGMTWQESQALLYQGKSAMMLIGNFITPNFPPEVEEQMDFFAFPEIAPEVGRYEEAPMNSVHIPARARNKEDAKKFLAFVARKDVQERINEALLQIPVNRESEIADDRFLALGRALLEQAGALTQYFDRDTREDLATVAMKGFQEFMVRPDRLDQILEEIERTRQRIYGS